MSVSLSVLLLAASVAAESPPDNPDHLVAAALEHNATLEALRHAIEASEAVTETGEVWADPMVSLQYSNMPIDGPIPGRHPMSGIQLMATQKLPWFGKTGARTEAKEAQVRVSELGLAEARNRIAAMVRQLWVELVLSRGLAKVNADHVREVEQFLRVLRAHQVTGKTRQAQVLQLELLKDQLADEQDDFVARARILEARLNGLMGAPPTGSIPTPEVLGLPTAPASLKSMIQGAVAQSPELARLEAEAVQSEAEAARLRKEGDPDVSVSLGYRVRLAVPGGDPGTDFLTVGAAMPLPWFWNDKRWGAQARMHERRAAASRSRRDAAIDTLRADLDVARTAWRRAALKSERYQSQFLPKARQVVNATLSDYQVGRADFSSLFQAEVQLLGLERAILKARADAWTRSVTVDQLTGSAGGTR